MTKRGNAWWLQRKSGGKFITRVEEAKKRNALLLVIYEKYATGLSNELVTLFEGDDEVLRKIQPFMRGIVVKDWNPIDFYKAFRDWFIAEQYIEACPDCDGKLLKMGNSRCETCEGRGYLTR